MNTNNRNNRTNRIGCVINPDGSIDIVVPASMAEDFKIMVKKGTNLAPDMHVEIRDFTDRLLGRDQFVGSCMKQELYGFPVYRVPGMEPQAALVVTSPDKIAALAEIHRQGKHCEGHPETCNCDYHAG